MRYMTYVTGEHCSREVCIAVVLEILDSFSLHSHRLDPLTLHFSDTTQDIVNLFFNHGHKRTEIDSRIGTCDLKPVRCKLKNKTDFDEIKMAYQFGNPSWHSPRYVFG